MPIDHTLHGVCAQSRREDIAAAAFAHLRTLGTEASTASLAIALGLSRWEVVASLMPEQERGALASRDSGGGQVMWRIERRHA